MGTTNSIDDQSHIINNDLYDEEEDDEGGENEDYQKE